MKKKLKVNYKLLLMEHERKENGKVRGLEKKMGSAGREKLKWDAN